MPDVLQKREIDEVAVVYHFFAHYRQPVCEELLSDPDHRYILCGDSETSVPSIKPWVPEDASRFIRCKLHMLGPMQWQSGLMKLALGRRFKTVIYLGNPNWLVIWLSAILARARGKRVLFWTHGWVKPERGIKQWIRNTFNRIAHGLLLYGHGAKSIGLANGFDAGRLHVIYNSLDYQKQAAIRDALDPADLKETRREFFENPELPILVCTTRLTVTRRLDQLLDAIKMLEQRGVRVNVLLVGDGPDEDRLKTLAKSMGLDVRFYGACYDENELGRLIMASDITIAPGKIGLTAMHSLAFGTPVITHGDPNDQMPEWEAIIPNVSGAFFERGNIEDLAKTIETYLENARDCDADHQRAACYRIIDRFYNPAFQRKAINRAVDGLQADDLFWMKPDASPSARS